MASPSAGTTARPSPEILRSPTLGAVMRARGLTGPCDEARVAFAVEVIEEARRRVIFDRLDGVLMGLSRGADPDVIARRLRRLADEVDGGPRVEERAA